MPERWGPRLFRLLRRGANAFMFALAIMSVPDTALAALQGSHCSQHAGPSTHVMNGGIPHASHGGSWVRSSHGPCPHCPVGACSSVIPCATVATFAAPSREAVGLLPLHRGLRMRAAGAVPHSTSSQPPTPPPQPIS